MRVERHTFTSNECDCLRLLLEGKKPDPAQQAVLLTVLEKLKTVHRLSISYIVLK